jgi:hypothetical protein
VSVLAHALPPRAVVDADHWPDDTVLLDLDRRAVCTKCGRRIEVNAPPRCLTGAQWR